MKKKLCINVNAQKKKNYYIHKRRKQYLITFIPVLTILIESTLAALLEICYSILLFLSLYEKSRSTQPQQNLMNSSQTRISMQQNTQHSRNFTSETQKLGIKSYELSVNKAIILTQRVRVIPQKTYHKILYLYPAVDQTYVFLGMLGLKRDCITHMDKNGNVLFEHVFEKPMDSLGMMSDAEAILIETRGNCITILDLKTHRFSRVSHHFFNEESDQASIHTFSESKLVCIEQVGRYNDNRFKLSYYKHPFKGKDKPLYQYQARDNEWTYEYIVKKANQHSLMVWFKPRMDHNWEFRTFDCRDNIEGKLEYHVFPQKVGVEYGLSNVQLAVTTLWEMSKGQFLFVCISSKQDTRNQDGIIQNNYVIDTNTSQIRQAKFSFGEYHDYLVDYHVIGPYSMFRTYIYEDGKALKTPVFYLNNSTEQIIAQQTWECSYLHKYEFPGYNGSTLVQNLYENGNCDWFQCMRKQIVEPKFMVLNLMLNMNEDFDEDLLQDVIEMIDFESAAV